MPNSPLSQQLSQRLVRQQLRAALVQLVLRHGPRQQLLRVAVVRAAAGRGHQLSQTLPAAPALGLEHLDAESSSGESTSAHDQGDQGPHGAEGGQGRHERRGRQQQGGHRRRRGRVRRREHVEIRRVAQLWQWSGLR